MSRPAVTGNGGKGDWKRPGDASKFDRNYIIALGATCPKCGGISGGCHYCGNEKIFDPDYYYRLGGS